MLAEPGIAEPIIKPRPKEKPIIKPMPEEWDVEKPKVLPTPKGTKS